MAESLPRRVELADREAAIRPADSPLQETAPASKDRSPLDQSSVPVPELHLDRLTSRPPPRGALLLTIALQTGAVFLGFLCSGGGGISSSLAPGFSEMRRICPRLIGLILVLLIVSFIRSVFKLAQPKGEWHCIASSAMLVYALIIFLMDSFLQVGNADLVIMAALLLASPLLLTGWFIRRRDWIGVAGVTLFVFTFSMMTFWNAFHGVRGVGFLRALIY